MKSQVMFYGNLQKAQMVLACIQHSITDCRSNRRTPTAAAILDRYAAELEEIEADLVALINTTRADPNSGDPRSGDWSGPSSDADIL